MTIIEFMEDFEARLFDTEVRCSDKTLILPTGMLIVAPTGITAKLKPPFSRLSRHYPWLMVAPSFAALRVLVAGEECETIKIVEQVLGLGEVPRGQRDADRFALEETSIWCGDVERIVRWGVGLAEVCPYESVARDLKLLPNLQPAALDHYVRSWLG